MPNRLIETEQLLIRTGQRDVSEISDLLDSMSLAATVYLEGEIFTSFDESTTSDTFYVVVQNKPHLTLALSNGFISVGSVVIKESSSLSGLRDNPTTVAPSEYEVTEDGVIVLYTAPTTHTYIKVEYGYGLPSASGVYDQDAVPEWLRELATQYVIYRVNSMAPFRKSKKSEAKSGEPVLLRGLLHAHVRLYPQALKPML